MKLLSLLFTNLLAFFMLTRVRRVVALTLAGALAFTAVAPPAKAQLGIPAIIAAAAQVVATITNVIGPLLSAIQGTVGAINGVLGQFREATLSLTLRWMVLKSPSPTQSSAATTFRGTAAASSAGC